MPSPTFRRLSAVLAGALLAALACSRADVAITPVDPGLVTPMSVFTLAPTSLATPIDTPAAATPTATAVPPTDVADQPTETSVVRLTPTETPTATFTPTETETPTRTLTPTRTPTRTLTPRATTPGPGQPTATSGGPTQPATAITPVGGGGAIPGNATFTQAYSVSNDGGTVFGRPPDMGDGRTETWASLRGGDAAWVFDLGASQRLAGVRLWPRADAGEPTTLRVIDVSADGTAWTTVYTGRGNCGVPSCDSLAQNQNVEIGFAATAARFIRLRSGPTRFAFAEVAIAVVP